MSAKLLVRKTGAIANLVINNPERHNAISFEMWRALPEILGDLERDAAVRAVVVSGAGTKAFASGADISEFDGQKGEALTRYNSARDEAQRCLVGVSKPLIAKIGGYCLGGGLAVALSCDVRIASERARFGIPAARLGLSYPTWGVRALLDVVGMAAAKDMFFTARQYSASEALGMGLVNHVVEEEALDGFSLEYARSVAANAPLTLASIKCTISELMKDEADRDLDSCERLIDLCYRSSDYEEGRAAFAEKRQPAFTGR